MKGNKETILETLNPQRLRNLSENECIAYYIMFCIIVDGNKFTRENLSNYPMSIIKDIAKAVNCLRQNYPGYEFTEEKMDFLATKGQDILKPTDSNLTYTGFKELHAQIHKFYLLMNEENLNEFQVVAKEFMKEIQYDNGCVNRQQKEHYPKLYFNRITIKVKYFILNNKGFDFTNETIQEICTGEVTEVENKYMKFTGFKGLYDSLNDYFNNYLCKK